MIAQAGNNWCLINFKREQSTSPFMWLVVDDYYAEVQAMVLGYTYEGETVEGLGDKCLDQDAATVETYANAGGIGDCDRKSLLHLPAIATSFEEIGAIAFVHFDAKDDTVKRIIASVGRDMVVAALLDVHETKDDVRMPDPQVSKALMLADKLGVPPDLRAVLSVGGFLEGLPDECRRLELVLKNFDKDADGRTASEPIEGVKGFIQNVKDWWLRATDPISSHLFNELTKRIAHSPSQLCLAAEEERRHIITAMTGRSDKHSVWLWCGKLACLEDIGREAELRWLAAKAYQQVGTTPVFPVTGFVALLHGASYFLNKDTPSFGVSDPLDDATDVDSRNILGHIKWKGGRTPDEFATALHTWLTHSEQRERGKVRIETVTTHVDRKKRRITLQMEYDGPLSTGLVGLVTGKGVPSDDKTRVREAWERLLAFCAEKGVGTEGDNCVCMEFAWSEGGSF